MSHKNFRVREGVDAGDAVTAPEFVGPLTGDVTGNVTGSVTGDVTGNVTGNLTGNVTGDVTGNVTGDVTGNVTGDVTGNVTGDVTGNLTGNVTGNLTGDVTGTVSSLSNQTTDALSEGTTNKYYTSERANTDVAAQIAAAIAASGGGGGGGGATLSIWAKTAAGEETSLSGNDDNSVSLSYVVGQELVYLNGALLVRGVDYTATTGTSITGLVALVADDILEVVSFVPSSGGTSDIMTIMGAY